MRSVVQCIYLLNIIQDRSEGSIEIAVLNLYLQHVIILCVLMFAGAGACGTSGRRAGED
jgi:hypothetical protein